MRDGGSGSACPGFSVRFFRLGVSKQNGEGFHRLQGLALKIAVLLPLGEEEPSGDKCRHQFGQHNGQPYAVDAQ